MIHHYIKQELDRYSKLASRNSIKYRNYKYKSYSFIRTIIEAEYEIANDIVKTKFNFSLNEIIDNNDNKSVANNYTDELKNYLEQLQGKELAEHGNIFVNQRIYKFYTTLQELCSSRIAIISFYHKN
jgi:DNA-binding protein Fis